VKVKKTVYLLFTGLALSFFCAKTTLAAGVLAESSAYVEAYGLVRAENSAYG